MASSFGFVALCFVGLFLPSTLGLDCYSCTWRYGPDIQDPGCLEFNPAMVGLTNVTGAPRVLNCTNTKENICTVKIVYQKSSGLKWNFERGCIPIGHPESTQGCTDSAEIYSCITACDTDLCNTGDGLPPGSTLPPPPGGGDGNHGGGNKGDNGASAVTATLTSLMLLPVAFILRF